MLSSNVLGNLSQFMVSQYLSLEDISDRAKELAFTDSVVQYVRGKIVAPTGGFP